MHCDDCDLCGVTLCDICVFGCGVIDLVLAIEVFRDLYFISSVWRSSVQKSLGWLLIDIKTLRICVSWNICVF